MGYACPAGSYCTEGSFAEKVNLMIREQQFALAAGYVL